MLTTLSQGAEAPRGVLSTVRLYWCDIKKSTSSGGVYRFYAQISAIRPSTPSNIVCPWRTSLPASLEAYQLA